jgi:hypothetical protein
VGRKSLTVHCAADEFKAYVEKKEGVCKELFDRVDANHDGKLTVDEVVRVQLPKNSHTLDAFKRIDCRCRWQGERSIHLMIRWCLRKRGLFTKTHESYVTGIDCTAKQWMSAGISRQLLDTW